MRLRRALALLIVALGASGATSAADAPDLQPGEVASPGAPAARSGYDFLGAELRALQNDDFANPGQLWVDRGRDLWRHAPTNAGSCADCHGEPGSLAGVAARMPRWDANADRLENLEAQINECRVERQNKAPWPWESDALLAMTALVATQSRGMPMDVDVSGPAAGALAAGERAFRRRRGRLDLACAHCHELHAGRRLRGDIISEGMVNGFPIYRLTWQTLGSRHRMFRWCNEAVEAEPYAYGADEYLALELYLAWRGRGLPIETPAVRR